MDENENAPQPMTDAELDALDASMTDRELLIAELQAEQREDVRRMRLELARRRREDTGATVHPIRPARGKPEDGPTPNDGCSL